MTKSASLIIALALLTGCANSSFTVNGAGSAPTQAKSQHYFVAGIGQKKDINAAEVCGGVDKVQKVEVQQTFLNGLLSVVTFNIYTPRMARVYCGE